MVAVYVFVMEALPAKVGLRIAKPVQNVQQNVLEVVLVKKIIDRIRPCLQDTGILSVRKVDPVKTLKLDVQLGSHVWRLVQE